MLIQDHEIPYFLTIFSKLLQLQPAEIYKQTIPLCTKVYLTLIETVVEEFDSEIDLDLLFNDKFKQTVVGKGIADEKNEFDYVYFELDRI